MTTDVENGKVALTPEQITEAEKYKEEANGFFKSKYFSS
jgi:hypothetical protein